MPLWIFILKPRLCSAKVSYFLPRPSGPLCHYWIAAHIKKQISELRALQEHPGAEEVVFVPPEVARFPPQMIPDLVLWYCVNWALSCSKEPQLRWDINLRPCLPAVRALTREKSAGRQEGWWGMEGNWDFSCWRLPFTRIHPGSFFSFFYKKRQCCSPSYLKLALNIKFSCCFFSFSVVITRIQKGVRAEDHQTSPLCCTWEMWEHDWCLAVSCGNQREGQGSGTSCPSQLHGTKSHLHSPKMPTWQPQCLLLLLEADKDVKSAQILQDLLQGSIYQTKEKAGSLDPCHFKALRIISGYCSLTSAFQAGACTPWPKSKPVCGVAVVFFQGQQWLKSMSSSVNWKWQKKFQGGGLGGRWIHQFQIITALLKKIGMSWTCFSCIHLFHVLGWR